MSETTFKILTIDGGGIKGLYSSTILEHLESKYGAMSNHFDMICGTSTGGLIALALGLKIPAVDISKIYIEHGKVIFPKRSRFGGIVRQTFWGGKYSDSPLRSVLKGVFQERRVKDLANLVCIPSYSLTDAKPWIFKRDHGELYRDNETLLVDVALATSAAPTYFPLCEIDRYDQKQFIDGGVWANNPTLVGVIEALTYFVGQGRKYQGIEVLSVSSLNNTAGKPVGLKRRRSFVNWRNDLFETSLIGQSAFTDYTMQRLSELTYIQIKYARIPSEQISAEQQHLVQLDCAIPKAINFIRGKGNDRGYLVGKDREIANYFRPRK
jgi:predicted acylesterase/phospholipase RssA